jgi:disulfide bond formation protein DsbB
LSAQPGRWFAALALVCALSVVLALVAQHRFDMQPCPWCILQRLAFVVIGLVALLAALLPAAAVHAAAAALIVVVALAGVAAALWQHFVATASASCNLTLADRIMSATGLDNLWPEVFAPMASCADAAARVFGVPFEFYSLALFVLLGGAALSLLLPARRRSSARR